MIGSVIATTKLAIPQPVRPSLVRERLLERLDDPSYRLGVVRAPAGYGKTALLATWADRHRDRVAWLSCDTSDIEPGRLWAGLVAAVSATWPGLGDDAAVLLDRGLDAITDAVVSLANDLGDLDGAPILVIDDLDLARPDRRLLAVFVDALPPNVQLVIGGRRHPALPLARRRVTGDLLELRADDLRFTRQEVAAVFDLGGVEVSESDLDAVHELIEGWPAGVRLTLLSLPEPSERSGFLEAFARTNRALSDFLVNEVLSRQRPELVEFMTEISVLDEFDAALCEAVSGRPEAGQLLDELCAIDLFVVQLDSSGEWYRFHHLFGAFLRARLKLGGRERLRQAHVRASEALRARGELPRAMSQAMAVGDTDRAASIVGLTLDRSLDAPHTELTAAAARAWLHEHGQEMAVTNPGRVLEFVAALSAADPSADIEWWLASVESTHRLAPPTITALIDGIRAEHHYERGQAEDALTSASRAEVAARDVASATGLLAFVPMVLVRAHLQADDHAGARTALDEVDRRPTGSPAVDDVQAPALRGWVAFAQGDLALAQQNARASLQRADELDLPHHDLGRIFAALTQGALHLERNDVIEATRYLDDVRTMAEARRRPATQSSAALQLARLANAMGDPVAAESHLTTARLVVPNASPSVRRMFAIDAVRLALLRDPGRAAELLRNPDVGRPPPAALRARLALAQGDPRVAASLLDKIGDPATTRDRVELGVLRALAQLDRNAKLADEHFRRALEAARPEGFVRTIIDLHPSVYKLLRVFSADDALAGYVRRLMEAADATASPPPRPEPDFLVEPLSRRELTVLRYLSSRLTNQEIASALYVSLNTVKSHLKAIYRKLSVNSRAGAVEAGRAHRLL